MHSRLLYDPLSGCHRVRGRLRRVCGGIDVRGPARVEQVRNRAHKGGWRRQVFKSDCSELGVDRSTLLGLPLSDRASNFKRAMLTPNGSLCHTRVTRRRDRDSKLRPMRHMLVYMYFVRNQMPHSASSTPKAVRSHTVCPTPHFAVEDGAKTEIRVGRVLLMNGDEVRALRFKRNAAQRKRTVLAVGSHISQLSTVCPTPEHFR